MIYFGENNEYILCECEICKREMYIERQSVVEEDAYSYHIAVPVKCACGTIDEYINRAKKSCHSIRRELVHLSDLLHKQNNSSNRIMEIDAEINKKFNPPTFWQSLIGDFIFSLKVFLIMLGSVIGVEIFLFIISALIFFFGLAFDIRDLSSAGNELFYNINVFKDRGGGFLSKFGMSETFPLLKDEPVSEQLILNYIPYAIVGVIIIVFYVFLAILIIKSVWDLAKLGFFATKVMNQKLKIIQKREEYIKELEELNFEMQKISDQIKDVSILSTDYKNIRATDAILRYFVNNRIDTIREAVNLFHDEDFKTRQLEYSKVLYNESKQTRRYTKALYMLTADENIKVDVRDEFADNNSPKPAESVKTPGKAFSKIRRSNILNLGNANKRTEQLTAKSENSESIESLESIESVESTNPKDSKPVYAIPSSSDSLDLENELDLLDYSNNFETENNKGDKKDKENENENPVNSKKSNKDNVDDISKIFNDPPKS